MLSIPVIAFWVLIFLNFEELPPVWIVVIVSLWGALAGGGWFGLFPMPVFMIGTVLLDIFLIFKYFGRMI